jgi:hypothetical protein
MSARERERARYDRELYIVPCQVMALGDVALPRQLDQEEHKAALHTAKHCAHARGKP